MASILIRDVPEEVRAELAARAARKGQSMQEFLKSTLIDLTSKPDIDAWLERVRERQARSGFQGVSAEEIVEALREERGSL